MVKIFKTNVETADEASFILKELTQLYNGPINFDLEDNDRIFRIEATNYSSLDIIKTFDSLGFNCVEIQ